MSLFDPPGEVCGLGRCVELEGSTGRKSLLLRIAQPINGGLPTEA